jgi:hypothetical protein
MIKKIKFIVQRILFVEYTLRTIYNGKFSHVYSTDKKLLIKKAKNLEEGTYWAIYKLRPALAKERQICSGTVTKKNTKS